MSSTAWTVLLSVIGTLGTIAVSLVGLYVYRRRAQVDVDALGAKSKIEAENTPVKLLQQLILQNQEQAKAFLEHNKKIIENHLEHDRQERVKLGEVMAENTEANRALSHQIQESRSEASRRSGAYHERLNELTRVISELKGALQARGGPGA